MRHLLLAFVFLLSGCVGTTYDLEPKWYPLKQIQERIGPGGWVSTIGDTVYVSDLEKFLEKHPVNSVSFNAKMAHERVHSYRQSTMDDWLMDYMTSREFRTYEEKLGWYVEINMLRRAGATADALEHWAAKSMLSYTPELGPESRLSLWIHETTHGKQWQPEHVWLQDFMNMRPLPE